MHCIIRFYTEHDAARAAQIIADYYGIRHDVEAPTIAERIAEEMGDDGTDYSRYNLAEEASIRYDYDGFRDLGRYVFLDGSAIVDCGEYWDVEGNEPFSCRGEAEIMEWTKATDGGYECKHGNYYAEVYWDSQDPGNEGWAYRVRDMRTGESLEEEGVDSREEGQEICEQVMRQQ